ncbi:alpha/beta fold hydrolase [Ilumatobacter sp.]|uniref:alpha/beta fold hydrolase n=1 Tax=Ilumatobacter sp. TaxID=1967498 RepID=UPI003C470C8F
MPRSISPWTVLVHGVPETTAIWTPLVSALEERGVTDIRLLSPPGFGAPLPSDFAAEASDYLGWLIAELDDLRAEDDRPIDIVGHDWGAGHVYGLAAERPDLVRSWVADIAGLLHPDYGWHDAAVAWQQPDVGEQMIEMMVATPVEDRIALFMGFGLPSEIAAELAPALDADMGRAILALYRSAREPELQALADRLAASDHGPGAVITATDDSYVAADLATPVAERLGVPEIRLDGQGHWWMVSDPERAADRLIAFWSGL